MSNNNLFNTNIEMGTNKIKSTMKVLYQRTQSNYAKSFLQSSRQLARLMFKISFNRALAY